MPASRIKNLRCIISRSRVVLKVKLKGRCRRFINAGRITLLVSKNKAR